jgi:thiol-disulfide isomerase/thioredoxin
MSFLQDIKLFLRPYKKLLFILLIFLIFIATSYYCYQTYYVKINTNASDVANANTNSKPAEIFFFYANWCPHCKIAHPEWQQFLEEYDGKVINNYKIKCIPVDCTNDSDSTVTNLVDEFKVDSYPTIKMKKDMDTIDFQAKVNKYNLEQFVNTVLT